MRILQVYADENHYPAPWTWKTWCYQRGREARGFQTEDSGYRPTTRALNETLDDTKAAHACQHPRAAGQRRGEERSPGRTRGRRRRRRTPAPDWTFLKNCHHLPQGSKARFFHSDPELCSSQGAPSQMTEVSSARNPTHREGESEITLGHAAVLCQRSLSSISAAAH